MRTKRSYYFLAFLFLPLLVVLQNPAVKEPVRGWSQAVLKPVLLTGQNISRFFNDFRIAGERFVRTFKEQGNQEERIAQLESQLVTFKELEKENERLRKIVDFRSTIPGKSIAARIIGSDPSPWRRSFILDKGTRHGLKKDMAVISFQGLVGRILEAGPETSRVILLTDLDARVSSLTDQSRAGGIVAGTGGNKLKMIYLDLDSGVQVQETVLTSGLGGLFPKGLRIGKITALTRDPSGLHIQADIEPFVGFSKLEEVLCLVSSPQKSS